MPSEPSPDLPTSAEAEESVHTVSVARFGRDSVIDCRDAVACEEPLEIQLSGAPLAVVMRTPGHDEELALGFLVTERVIQSLDDLLSLRHCSIAPHPEAEGNVMRVLLRPGVPVDLEGLRRNLYASASCGICGKATIENALRIAKPLDDSARFPRSFFSRLMERMRSAQRAFERTGGIHAAALVAPEGALLVVREDVGRHNAVDKVVGWAAGRGMLPLGGHALLVSGRISYEIVQKALAARIPLVAAVSAPTSLATRLAEQAGIGLVGFLRGPGFNVYGRRERVAEDGA
ncbi:MAG TPA: formate dehydrogenase accessory sulfurtransferase FdhD [Deltaproteobacteria bacterium]|nr:formate dehydrogenase accessory sulfurtransferase FdhD [Deltaproteobacteria bacterium]